MVKSECLTDGFSLDIWGKPSKPNMASQTQLPVKGFKRSFQKPHGKFRWYLIIGISVLIALMTIVVVTVAVHFSTNSADKENLKTAKIVDDTTDADGQTKPVQPSGVDTATSSLHSQTTTNIDALPTSFHPAPSEAFSRSTTLSNVLASKTTHFPIHAVSDVTHRTTEQPKLSDVFEPDDTTTTASPVPVLTFASSYLTYDNKRLTLACEAVNVEGWSDLHIIRHHNNVHETVGIVTAGFQIPSVSVLDPAFNSQISFKDDAIGFVLETDASYCSDFRNFSCTVRAIPGTMTAFTEVRVKQLQPLVTVPKAVVAGTNITMQCSAQILGVNGTVKWKFRPPGMDTFYDLSTRPLVSQEITNCSKSINSTLVFNPKESDNGSYFRCVLEGVEGVIKDIGTPKTDVEFYVIPETFCADKRVYTVHAHPYSPCNLVVYCFQTGPIVYEINCDPGTCYDKDKTMCV